MAQVCDFSTPQNLAVVKQHFVGIIRYASDTPSKNISKAEFDQAKSLGLTVTLVMEQGVQPAMRGAAGGTHDACVANGQADAIGYATDGTVFYVAEDPNQLPSSEWPTVDAYFGALSGRPRGGYGGWATLNHLHGLGLITKGWMVETWNQGAPDPLPPWIVLVQLVGAPTYGLSIDADNVLQADYGQDPRPVPPQPTPTEEEMPLYVITRSDGAAFTSDLLTKVAIPDEPDLKALTQGPLHVQYLGKGVLTDAFIDGIPG